MPNSTIPRIVRHIDKFRTVKPVCKLEGSMKRVEYRMRHTCSGCGVVFVGGAIGEGAGRVTALAKRGIRAVDLGDRFVWGKSCCPLCGANIYDTVELEWADTCRKCGKAFEDEYEHMHVTRFWNKVSQQYNWQCKVCTHPKRRAQ